MSTRKTAVVTGGTRGIGRALSLALARAGYTVHAVYVRRHADAQALEREAAAQGLDLRARRADLTDDAQVAALAEALRQAAPRVDVLVHSAASGVHRGVLELSLKHLSWTLGVNVLAVHRLLLALSPMMGAGARIVGLTSYGGTHALPHYGAVGASKGALEALLRHYARELAPRGIAVNLVCPGMVLTEALEAFPDQQQRVHLAQAQTPSGRLTRPEDVAAAVLFLCSDGAAQIVGQTLVIDGGRQISAMSPHETLSA